MRRDERGEKEKALWEKICWFKEQLVEGKDKYSLYEVSQLIAIYIDRFQARMEEIDSANSLNKQLQRRGANAAAEEAAIKMVREREMNMFITGAFEAPDLTNRTNVKILRKTTDDVNQLHKIKMKKFKQQEEQEEESRGMEVEEEMEEDGEEDGDGEGDEYEDAEEINNDDDEGGSIDTEEEEVTVQSTHKDDGDGDDGDKENGGGDSPVSTDV